MNHHARQRIVLAANDHEGWPMEEAIVEAVTKETWGVSLVVRVSRNVEDEYDDGLREVTDLQVDEDATRHLELAVEIEDMLDRLTAGLLKRTAGDFISGLITAYSIVTGIEDLGEAKAHALEVARRKVVTSQEG